MGALSLDLSLGHLTALFERQLGMVAGLRESAAEPLPQLDPPLFVFVEFLLGRADVEPDLLRPPHHLAPVVAVNR